jgi:Fe-Mn family superoxide dismutase
MQSFQDKFRDAATGQFGSGWAWLVADGSGNLAIETTGNAKTPVSGNQRPLLVCDVWEHAYYLDYQNKRGTYVDKFWEIINWDFASKNFSAEQARKFKSL